MQPLFETRLTILLRYSTDIFKAAVLCRVDDDIAKIQELFEKYFGFVWKYGIYIG